MEEMINKAVDELKKWHYEPTAVWLSFDGDKFWVVTDDIDRSQYCKLLKKFS
jgi:hypothetical protein